MSTIPQVAAAHYGRLRYLSLARIVTHWHQMREVARWTPPRGRVLEIGPGGGHVSWLLRHFGYDVTTCDLDPELQPDVVANVRQLPFEDGAFDTVLAAEVLEHLPFEQFSESLADIARVTRDAAVITLPAPFVGLSLLMNVPRLEPCGVSIGVPYMRKHRFRGEHYWELGKRGYGKRRIRECCASAGLQIVREFRPAPSLFCYFFVTRRVPAK